METEPFVYLVDDDERLREAIRLLLKSVGLSLHAYGTAQEFLNDYDPKNGGVLILDIRLPGMSGLELQQRLRESGDNIPIIVLSAHGDVPMTVRAMKAGALDFLEKPFNDQVLLDLIQHGLEEDERRKERRVEQRQVLARMETLTRREREVMELLAIGIPNKDIADQLEISRKTLDIHRSKVLQKMKADTIGDLVRMVMNTQELQGSRKAGVEI